jgi:hypothetical protein
MQETNKTNNIKNRKMKDLQITKNQLVALTRCNERPQFKMGDGTLYRALSKAELASSNGVWMWAPRDTLAKDADRFANA